ncbi:tetraspanin [Echinococcus multilocularis]|uniref:Tetraspanin n=1 Tax=Echinococcus multilocularis TaxID=6211 RepID=A0A068Y051_ECHMU|nr:tetraspanin [Echinococcus multilocularis]
MGCVISCGLKLVLQVLNTVLCVAFLAVAVFGILLKSSKSIVQQLLSKIFDQFNVDGIALTLVVVGLALAALCLIGCIASCCGCNILLKIYAFILIVILVVEIIAVSVVFSDSTKLASLIVKEMEILLESFNGTSKEGKMSTTVWTVAMTIGSTCCGMDGHGDFDKLNKSLPLQCCNMTKALCDSTTAQAANVSGCRDKIGALIVIVMLTICL